MTVTYFGFEQAVVDGSKLEEGFPVVVPVVDKLEEEVSAVDDGELEPVEVPLVGGKVEQAVMITSV